MEAPLCEITFCKLVNRAEAEVEGWLPGTSPWQSTLHLTKAGQVFPCSGFHQRGAQALHQPHVEHLQPRGEVSGIRVDFHMDGGSEGVVRLPEGWVSIAPRPSCAAHPATGLLIALFRNALRSTAPSR